MIQRLKPATVVNVSGDRRKFQIDSAPGVMPDVHELAPGESVEIPGAYAVRRQTGPGRELLPSIVEMLTGGGVIPAGQWLHGHRCVLPSKDGRRDRLRSRSRRRCPW